MASSEINQSWLMPNRAHVVILAASSIEIIFFNRSTNSNQTLVDLNMRVINLILLLLSNPTIILSGLLLHSTAHCTWWEWDGMLLLLERKWSFGIQRWVIPLRQGIPQQQQHICEHFLFQAFFLHNILVLRRLARFGKELPTFTRSLLEQWP